MLILQGYMSLACIIFHSLSYTKMKTLARFRLLLILAMASIVGLNGDKLKNGTVPGQGNATLVALSGLERGDGVKVKSTTALTMMLSLIHVKAVGIIEEEAVVVITPVVTWRW